MQDRTQRTCRVCGKTFRDKRCKAVTCSMCCARRNTTPATCLNCGKTFGAHPLLGTKYCSKSCAGIKNAERRGRGSSPDHCPVPYGECQECHSTIVARGGRRYCSKDCQRRSYYRRQGAKVRTRLMGLYWAAVSTGRVRVAMHWRRVLIQYLRERDGNRCPICGRTMQFTGTTGPRGQHSHGATIDHVVPRSHGGTDDLANLRLVGWQCNRDRGNRGGHEQLALIG